MQEKSSSLHSNGSGFVWDYQNLGFFYLLSIIVYITSALKNLKKSSFANFLKELVEFPEARAYIISSASFSVESTEYLVNKLAHSSIKC